MHVAVVCCCECSERIFLPLGSENDVLSLVQTQILRLYGRETNNMN